MDWLDLSSPQVQAALIAALASIAVALINRHNQRAKQDRKARR